MKVADVMHTTLFSVTEETPIKEVARLIFTIGISGVPVLKGKKLIGIITEHDILSRMYPTIEELMEDYVHVKDFEKMEERLVSLLETPVKNIMNSQVTTGTVDLPLMEAQSTMLVRQFSRLPIVDKENNLIGIVSQGDIFRQLLKKEIPKIEKERYAGFIAKYYDPLVNWGKRFAYEFPVLLKLFKEKNIKSVIDLGAWTGEYAIGLLKKGNLNKILGLDHNEIMIKVSEEKKVALPANIRKKINFMLTDFTDFSKRINEKYDAVISMGNAFPYIPARLEQLFEEISKILRDKNAVVVLQILNFEKIIKTQNRLLDFTIQKSKTAENKETLAVEFFDKGDKDCLTHHVIIFESDGKNWIYQGTTSIPVCYPEKNQLEKIFKKYGFKEISFSGSMGEYQGEYGELSFTDKFDPLKSDWLNVVAIR